MMTGGNTGLIAQVTYNGGLKWQPMIGSSEMTDEMAFDPFAPGRVILMDELSNLKVSNDLGLHYTPLAPCFSGARVNDIEITDQGNNGHIFLSNLGFGVSQLSSATWRMNNLFTSGIPVQATDWEFMDYSPDYAYDMEIDDSVSTDIKIYASYSPKKFENFGAVYKYSKNYSSNNGWQEVLKVNNSKGISSIKKRPGNPNCLYAGATGQYGRIYKTIDGGKNWTILNQENFTFVTVHEIAVDPQKDSIVYAAPWGGGLFRSEDGGQTWKSISTPSNSLVSVVIDPKDSNHLLLGDRNGPTVFESTDYGITWNI
jgi:hypothetical protein